MSIFCLIDSYISNQNSNIKSIQNNEKKKTNHANAAHYYNRGKRSSNKQQHDIKGGWDLWNEWQY